MAYGTDKPVGPAGFNQVIKARRFIGEQLLELRERLRKGLKSGFYRIRPS